MIPWRKGSFWLLRALLPSARSLRMAAYAAFAFGALALAAARSVYADVREMGLGVGPFSAQVELASPNSSCLSPEERTGCP